MKVKLSISNHSTRPSSVAPLTLPSLISGLIRLSVVVLRLGASVLVDLQRFQRESVPAELPGLSVAILLLSFSFSALSVEDKMGFIMEFAENLILKLMEDPKERDRKFREHVYSVKDRCQKTKEMWSYPLRPYGFWTFERHNSQLAWDAQISQAPGRRDPYDDVLQRNSGSSK